MEENTIEIDLETLSKENIYFLLKESCSKDISINKVIEECLRKFLNDYEKDKNQLVFNF